MEYVNLSCGGIIINDMAEFVYLFNTGCLFNYAGLWLNLFQENIDPLSRLGELSNLSTLLLNLEYLFFFFVFSNIFCNLCYK